MSREISLTQDKSEKSSFTYLPSVMLYEIFSCLNLLEIRSLARTSQLLRKNINKPAQGHLALARILVKVTQWTIPYLSTSLFSTGALLSSQDPLLPACGKALKAAFNLYHHQLYALINTSYGVEITESSNKPSLIDPMRARQPLTWFLSLGNLEGAISWLDKNQKTLPFSCDLYDNTGTLFIVEYAKNFANINLVKLMSHPEQFIEEKETNITYQMQNLRNMFYRHNDASSSFRELAVASPEDEKKKELMLTFINSDCLINLEFSQVLSELYVLSYACRQVDIFARIQAKLLQNGMLSNPGICQKILEQCIRFGQTKLMEIILNNYQPRDLRDLWQRAIKQGFRDIIQFLSERLMSQKIEPIQLFSDFSDNGLLRKHNPLLTWCCLDILPFSTYKSSIAGCNDTIAAVFQHLYLLNDAETKIKHLMFLLARDWQHSPQTVEYNVFYWQIINPLIRRADTTRPEPRDMDLDIQPDAELIQKLIILIIKLSEVPFELTSPDPLYFDGLGRSRSHSLLAMAAAHGYPKILSFLLKHGAEKKEEALKKAQEQREKQLTDPRASNRCDFKSCIEILENPQRFIGKKRPLNNNLKALTLGTTDFSI